MTLVPLSKTVKKDYFEDKNVERDGYPYHSISKGLTLWSFDKEEQRGRIYEDIEYVHIIENTWMKIIQE